MRLKGRGAFRRPSPLTGTRLAQRSTTEYSQPLGAGGALVLLPRGFNVEKDRWMRSAYPLAAVFAVAMPADLASAMAPYKWKYRPLVVFADSATSPPLIQQRQIVAASRGGFVERNVVVVWVVGNSVSSELGPEPGQSANALRARVNAQAGTFRVVLVGKDGGAKLAVSSPLSAASLFGTIDAMPMRRDEMRRR